MGIVDLSTLVHHQKGKVIESSENGKGVKLA
jgi:hypothetical protein